MSVSAPHTFMNQSNIRTSKTAAGRSAMTSLTRFATSAAGLVLMTFGPAVTLFAAPHVSPAWDTEMVRIFITVALIMWTPFTPLGVPSLLLQDERDKCTRRRGLLRIAPVAAHLAVTGPVRVVVATWCNLAGVVFAAMLFI
jgi:hypothetical protein